MLNIEIIQKCEVTVVSTRFQIRYVVAYLAVLGYFKHEKLDDSETELLDMGNSQSLLAERDSKQADLFYLSQH